MWLQQLVLGSLENKGLKSVVYVIERTRGAVGYGQSQAERKVGSRTQEVQERNSEGYGMERHADSSRLSDVNMTHSLALWQWRR